VTGSPFGAARCSLAGNLDGQWGTAQAGDALRAAALQSQIRVNFKQCLKKKKSKAINKTARRANHFRFTESHVKPQNKKYFALSE